MGWTEPPGTCIRPKRTVKASPAGEFEAGDREARLQEQVCCLSATVRASLAEELNGHGGTAGTNRPKPPGEKEKTENLVNSQRFFG